MSESILTLTTPEDRSATTVVDDVNKVQIADPITIDFAQRTISFQYTKGYVSGAIIEITETSPVIIAQITDFDAIVGAAVEAADTLGENLTRVLLQYLIDKDLVEGGTITP